VSGEWSADTTHHSPLTTHQPKVTDFGLAKHLDQAGLSRSGELIGTPAYMAPEQAAGSREVGPAADVYALGAILYECLTGRPPFQGDSPVSILVQVTQAEPVQPSRLRPGVPRDLETVCLKCLEKDPARRYATAAELAEDLRRYLAGEPTVARPVSVAGRVVKLVRRHPLTAGLLSLLAATLAAGLAGVLWQWRAAVAARGDLQRSLVAEADQRRQAEQNLYYGRIAQAVRLWEGGEADLARDVLAGCRPGPGRDDWRGWEWHYLSRQFRSERRVVRVDDWANALALIPGDPVELAVAAGRPRRGTAVPPSPALGRAGFLRPAAGDFRPGPEGAGGATEVAVQPNGPLVAWAAGGRIVLADWATGQHVRTITLPAAASAVTFTPDGASVVALAGHERLYVLDPATGAVTGEHPSGVDSVGVLAFHPDGHWLAVGGSIRGMVRVLGWPAGRTAADLGLQIGVAAVGFSPDGRTLAAAGSSGEVTLWDVVGWREVRRFQGHAGGVHALAFHPTGPVLATGGADRTVRLWQRTTGQPLAVYRGHAGPVRSLVFGPAGDWLASGAQDQTVRVWDATRDPRGRLFRLDGRLNDVAFEATPAGMVVRAAHVDGGVRAWSAADGRVLAEAGLGRGLRPDRPARHTAFFGGGRRVATVPRSDPRAVVLRDADTGRPVGALPAGDGPVLAIAADATGRWLAWATAGPDGGAELRWWDAAAEVAAGSARLTAADVRALAVEPGGGRTAVLAAPPDRPAGEQVVWLIDPAAPSGPPREIARGPGLPGGLTFGPGGRTLAVATAEAVHVYDADSGVLRHAIPCPPGMTGVAFNPDGRRLAAVDADGVVTLADPATGKVAFQFHGLARPRPNDLAVDARVMFSPDGHWLASTNWDGTLNLWDGRPADGE
jgi:WD40 repeat protein